MRHVYIPKIEGKEKRKAKPSKQGLLGVEGMEPDVLLRLLSPFTLDGAAENEHNDITTAEFYLDGFTGRDNSSALRASLARHLELPDDMSAKALLAAINLLLLQDKYKEFVNNSL